MPIEIEQTEPIEPTTAKTASEAIVLLSTFARAAEKQPPASLPELTISPPEKSATLTGEPRPDGSRVTRNETGKVQEVVKPNGAKTSFGYDQNGDLNLVVQDHERWHHTGNDLWVNQDGVRRRARAAVASTGDYLMENNTGVLLMEHPNGQKTVLSKQPATTCIWDEQGKVIETVDMQWRQRKYSYDKSNQVQRYEETAPDGSRADWSTTNGVLWTNKLSGEQRTERLQVNANDGALVRKGTGIIVERLDEKTPIEISLTSTLAKVGAINYSIPGNFKLVTGILKDASEPERDELKRVYFQQHGRTIEERLLEFKDEFKQEVTRVALNRKDGTPDYAGNIRVAILESQVSDHDDARTRKNCEKDIRDILARLNSEQTQQVQRDYLMRYGKAFTIHLAEAGVSPATRQSLSFLMRGSEADEISADDTRSGRRPRYEHLLETALQFKDAVLAEEALRLAPATMRDRLFQKHQPAFARTFPDYEARRIADYTRCGRLSEATQVIDNMHDFGDNVQGIELALANMPASARRLYLIGKQAESSHSGQGFAGNSQSLEGKTVSLEEARSFYRTLKEQLWKAAGTNISRETNEWRRAQMARWEDLIAVPGGTLVGDLAHHCGIHVDSSLEKISSAIMSMPQEQLDKVGKLSAPDKADRLQAARECLSIFKKPTEVDHLMDLINTRLTTRNRDLMRTLKEVSSAYTNPQDICKAWLRQINDPESFEEFSGRMTNRAWRATFDKSIGNTVEKAYPQILLPILKGERPEGLELLNLFGHDVDGVADAAALMSDSDRHRAAELGRQIWSRYPSRRQVVTNIIAQGKACPEDIVRGSICDTSFGSPKEKLSAYLQSLNSQERAKMISEYARKYSKTEDGSPSTAGGSIHSHLYRHLGPCAETLLATRGTPVELIDRSLQQFYRSYDGDGRRVVDSRWLGDGTGFQSRDAANRLVAIQAEASRKFENLKENPKFTEALTNLHQALKEFKASKNANSEAVINAMIGFAAVAGIPFSGGVSLSAIFIAGACLKCAGKQILQGVDYDPDDALIDAITGGVDAATALIAPRHLAAALGIGSRAASNAVEKLAFQLGEKAATKQAIGELCEASMQTALVCGKQIDDKAIAAIASRLESAGVTAGMNSQTLQQTIKNTLTDHLQSSQGFIQQLGRQGLLVTASGSAGGGVSGATRGLLEWNFRVSIQENLKQAGTYTAAGMGAGAAGAIAMHGVMMSLHNIRNVLPDRTKVKPAAPTPGKLPAPTDSAVAKPASTTDLTTARLSGPPDPAIARLTEELNEIDTLLANQDADIHRAHKQFGRERAEIVKEVLAADESSLPELVKKAHEVRQNAEQHIAELQKSRDALIRSTADRRKFLELARDHAQGHLSPGTYMFKGGSGEVAVMTAPEDAKSVPLGKVEELMYALQPSRGNHQDPVPSAILFNEHPHYDGSFSEKTGTIRLNLKTSRPMHVIYAHELGHQFDDKILERVGSPELKRAIADAYKAGLEKGALDGIASAERLNSPEQLAQLKEQMLSQEFFSMAKYSPLRYVGCRDEVMAEMYFLYKAQLAHSAFTGKELTYSELVKNYADKGRAEMLECFDQLYEVVARDAFPKLKQPRHPFARLDPEGQEKYLNRLKKQSRNED